MHGMMQDKKEKLQRHLHPLTLQLTKFGKSATISSISNLGNVNAGGRLDGRCPVEEPANVLLQLALTLPNGQGLPTLPDLSAVIGMVPLPSLSKCSTVSSNSLQEQATASGLQDLWLELFVPNRSLQDGRSNHWKKSKRSF